MNTFDEFINACKSGDTDKVKELLPRVDPKAEKSYALRLAAEKGHLDIVKLLLPVSDPKSRESYALCWAAMNGHVDIVNFLWEYSDPKKALKNMMDNDLPESKYFLIKQRLQIKESKEFLERSLKEQTEKKPVNSKPKM